MAAVTFRISLGMIVKDEGRTLRRCLESVAPFVDEIVIGLGGESTDNTEEIAREFTEKIFPIEWTSDFSAARNQVLERVTGDYFLWLDGDDELIGGEKLRELITTNPNTDGFYMGYDYSRDENGNCICYLVRERVVRLQDELEDRGWRWIGKVHEVLASHDFQESAKLVEDIVVRHNKPVDKHDPDRNIKILYAQLEEQEPEPDPRILGYLCTENFGRGNLKEAILHGQRFVKVSGWAEEKYQMQHRIADMYRLSGEYKKAIDADRLAIEIMPTWPDAWLGLAETYNAVGNYQSVVEYTKAAGTKAPPKTMLIINPLDYSFFPQLILASAYAQLGDFEMAIANYEKAYQVKPDEGIAKLIAQLHEEVRLKSVVNSFLQLREQLGRNDEWLKVRQLYNAVPKAIEQHPLIQETWTRSMFQTAHVLDPSIMTEFYTGNPNWVSMKEETIKDPKWLEYPRVKFALDIANRIHAKTIVDWGCSDGFISLPLGKETGARVTGFDLDPRCIELASLRAEEWGVQARFEVGNIDEVGGWEGEKADLALFFEVIEHVVHPEQTLARLEKTAKHIAITTPYLSWEGGNIPAWDRLEPKGHLRILDQYDMEKLLVGRGKIENLYREPWSNRGWLFAEYEPGRMLGPTIMIGAQGSPELWNPHSFETTGLGGSETAVIRLAEAFAKKDYRAIVYSNIDEPGYYSGACYRDATHYRPEIRSDMYISWRMPEAADWDINTEQLVLWMHDTDAGDRLTKERARRFDSIVVLSDWHKQFMLEHYPFLDAEKLIVIGNGVDLARFAGKVKRESHRVIYSSSPDRGLDIILEHIWPKVVEAVPDAELHIYYGWNNFDRFAPAYPQLRIFKNKIMNLLIDSKGVVQHGRVSQKELATAFQKSRVWLYPTYFMETYCITGIEAQLGGAIPITSQLAGLQETVKSGVFINGDVHDSQVQEQFAHATIQALTYAGKDQSLHSRVKKFAPAKSWDEIAALWLSKVFWKGEITNGERSLRPGSKLLPPGFDQLVDHSDQNGAGVDLESTDGLRLQRIAG